MEKIKFTGQQVELILVKSNEFGWYDLFFDREFDWSEQDRVIAKKFFSGDVVKDENYKPSKPEIEFETRYNKFFTDLDKEFKKEMRINPIKCKIIARLFDNTLPASDEELSIKTACDTIARRLPFLKQEI